MLNISLSDRFEVVTMKRDWLIKKIYQYSQISNLKTNDLIIYLATRKYKVDKLLTLDKKLQSFNSLNYDKD